MNKVFIILVVMLFFGGIPAEDYPSSHGSLPDELTDWDQLRGLDENAYAKMKLDDPVLGAAYVRVFDQSASGSFPDTDLPEYSGALADLRKRGDQATPLLMELMADHPESRVESDILASIDGIGTISLAPYLEYARNLIRTRAMAINAELAACAGALLSNHGTASDVELLEWLIKERPYVADSVTRKAEFLKRRLGLAPPILPRETSPIPMPGHSNNTTPSPANQRVNDTPFLSLANPWLKWSAMGFIVAGLGFWFAAKQRGRK